MSDCCLSWPLITALDAQNTPTVTYFRSVLHAARPQWDFPYPDLGRKVAEHVGLLLVMASHHSIRRSKHPDRNLFQAFFRSLLEWWDRENSFPCENLKQGPFRQHQKVIPGVFRLDSPTKTSPDQSSWDNPEISGTTSHPSEWFLLPTKIGGVKQRLGNPLR